MRSRRTDRKQSYRFPTGVDTIRLLLPFKVIGSLPNFRVRQSIQAGSLLYLNNGWPVMGVFSLWHDQDRNLRVRIARGGLTRGRVMCWLEFNPARLLRGSNARPVNDAELQIALNQAEQRLRAEGLEADFENCKISRIDITRDIHLPRAPDFYWPLLHRLDTPYNNLGQNYPNGMFRGGKSLLLCLYGKNKQMQEASGGTADESQLPGPNTMRIEWRLRNTQSVRYHLGSNALSLFRSRFTTHWVSEKMDKFLQGSLFQEPLPTCTHIAEVSAPTTPLEEWKALFESLGADRKHVKQLLTVHAYDHMVDDIEWHIADRILRHNFASAPSALTSLRHELRLWRLLYLRSPHGIPYAQLYIEFHRAVFAHPSHGDDVVGSALPLIPLKDTARRSATKPPSKRPRRKK